MSSLSKYGVLNAPDKLHEEIVYNLALIYNIINNRISNYLKNYQLTPAKLNILLVIKHHGQESGIRQVEISKHLIVTPSNMTKMIDKLEKEGLVVRSALEGDRRVNIINITKKGIELIDFVWEGYNNKLKEVIQSLSENKQKQLAESLSEWFESLK